MDGDFLDADLSCSYEPTGKVPLVESAALTYGAPISPSQGAGLTWTAEARSRLQRIPSFVRPVVVKRIESYARRNGEPDITV